MGRPRIESSSASRTPLPPHFRMAAATHHACVMGSPCCRPTKARAQIRAPGARGASPLAMLASAEPTASTRAAKQPRAISSVAGC
eukprot:205100-Alexandrium_andersonii.AAC.1